jgi:hypothetical protein
MKHSIQPSAKLTGKRPVIINIATASAIAALIATSASAVYAQDTSGTPNTPEKRAMEAAKKGPDELRRFIHRTRMIYGLYYGDFAGKK